MLHCTEPKLYVYIAPQLSNCYSNNIDEPASVPHPRSNVARHSRMEHSEAFCEAFRPPKPPGPPVAIMAQRYGRLLHRTFVCVANAFIITGNTQQLTGRHSNEWNKRMTESYGPLSRLTGPFSVSTGLSPHTSHLYIGPLIDFLHIAYVAQCLRPEGVIQHSDQRPGCVVQERGRSQVRRCQAPE